MKSRNVNRLQSKNGSKNETDLDSFEEHRLMNETYTKKLEACWLKLLRQIVDGGWSRPPGPNDINEDEFNFSQK